MTAATSAASRGGLASASRNRRVKAGSKEGGQFTPGPVADRVPPGKGLSFSGAASGRVVAALLQEAQTAETDPGPKPRVSLQDRWAKRAADEKAAAQSAAKQDLADRWAKQGETVRRAARSEAGKDLENRWTKLAESQKRAAHEAAKQDLADRWTKQAESLAEDALPPAPGEWGETWVRTPPQTSLSPRLKQRRFPMVQGSLAQFETARSGLEEAAAARGIRIKCEKNPREPGWYDPRTQTIMLSEEICRDPALYVFSLAHELAHAADPVFKHRPHDYEDPEERAKTEIVAERAAVYALGAYGLHVTVDQPYQDHWAGKEREASRLARGPLRRLLHNELHARWQVAACLLSPGGGGITPGQMRASVKRSMGQVTHKNWQERRRARKQPRSRSRSGGAGSRGTAKQGAGKQTTALV